MDRFCLRSGRWFSLGHTISSTALDTLYSVEEVLPTDDRPSDHMRISLRTRDLPQCLCNARSVSPPLLSPQDILPAMTSPTSHTHSKSHTKKLTGIEDTANTRHNTKGPTHPQRGEVRTGRAPLPPHRRSSSCDSSCDVKYVPLERGPSGYDGPMFISPQSMSNKLSSHSASSSNSPSPTTSPPHSLSHSFVSQGQQYHSLSQTQPLPKKSVKLKPLPTQSLSFLPPPLLHLRIHSETSPDISSPTTNGIRPRSPSTGSTLAKKRGPPTLWQKRTADSPPLPRRVLPPLEIVPKSARSKIQSPQHSPKLPPLIVPKSPRGSPPTRTLQPHYSPRQLWLSEAPQQSRAPKEHSNGPSAHFAAKILPLKLSRQMQTEIDLLTHHRFTSQHIMALEEHSPAQINGVTQYVMLLEHCDKALSDELVQVSPPSSPPSTSSTADSPRGNIVGGPLCTFHQICLGVAALHMHNLVHYNVCAQNVFRKEKLYKLANFSMVCSGDTYLTHEDRIQRMNAVYPAPELFSSDPCKSHTSSDIWSLGCLLFLLLNNRGAFTVPGPPSVNSLAAVHACIFKKGGKLQHLIFKMLSLDPSQRPNINGVIEAVETHLLKHGDQTKNSEGNTLSSTESSLLQSSSISINIANKHNTTSATQNEHSDNQPPYTSEHPRHIVHRPPTSLSPQTVHPTSPNELLPGNASSQFQQCLVTTIPSPTSSSSRSPLPPMSAPEQGPRPPSLLPVHSSHPPQSSQQNLPLTSPSLENLLVTAGIGYPNAKHLAQLLVENQVDTTESLSYLTDSNFDTLGVSIGDRAKIRFVLSYFHLGGIAAPEMRNLTNVVPLTVHGRGNFGHIFRGIWAGTTLVAMKSLSASKDPTRPNFEELNILTTLRHPHVVQVFGHAKYETQKFLVMELCDGNTLDLVRNHNLSLDTRLRMAADAAAGMEYLCTLRIVHRDLAARNLLYTKHSHGYRVLISDFGLATFSVEDYRTTLSVVACRWAAIETLNSGICTSASDVWSLGVAIWELLTNGQVPFIGLPEAHIRGLINAGERLAIPPECPPSLAEVLKQCWDPLPPSRPSFTYIYDTLCQETASHLQLTDDFNRTHISEVTYSAILKNLP
ncbi:tyrosine-protein kinase fes fps [Pelomyxa schiedti]|nr:tyrosine-protein kinase fes fps [Pelomyxa schiedti]